MLGSDFLPSHTPGGRESNVLFAAVPSPSEQRPLHYCVPFSPGLLPQAHALPSLGIQIQQEKVIIDDGVVIIMMI